jgi:hypothetical protein
MHQPCLRRLASTHGYRTHSSTSAKRAVVDESLAAHNITRDLIQAASQGNRFGWNYTKNRRSEEIRLRNALPKSRAPSSDRTNFSAVNPVELSDLEQTSPDPILPGTFVEIRRLVRHLVHLFWYLHSELFTQKCSDLSWCRSWPTILGPCMADRRLIKSRRRMAAPQRRRHVHYPIPRSPRRSYPLRHGPNRH